jgi:hypothetical protein
MVDENLGSAPPATVRFNLFSKKFERSARISSINSVSIAQFHLTNLVDEITRLNPGSYSNITTFE